MEDLFQIGVIGLIKAIDKFDLTLGLKFSTYAVPMITGEIKRFLRDDGPVKVSRTIKENGTKVSMARGRLQDRGGREPTLQELAQETGLSVEDVVLALEANTCVESIYAAVYQDDGSEVYLVDKVVRGRNGAVGRMRQRGYGEGGTFEPYALEAAFGQPGKRGQEADLYAVFSEQDTDGGGRMPGCQPGAGQPHGEEDSAEPPGKSEISRIKAVRYRRTVRPLTYRKMHDAGPIRPNLHLQLSRNGYEDISAPI